MKDALRVAAAATFAASTLTSADRQVFSVRNVSLREIIAFAYGIADDRDDELIGPPWLSSEKFDIEATCPPETPRERVTQMMHTLLAERFGLMNASREAKAEASALVRRGRARLLHPSSSGADQSLDASFRYSEGRVTDRAMSMQAFANLGARRRDDATASAPSIFTAIQEQLGLKLEPRKIIVLTLIVERVERIPFAN